MCAQVPAPLQITKLAVIDHVIENVQMWATKTATAHLEIFSFFLSLQLMLGLQ